MEEEKEKKEQEITIFTTKIQQHELEELRRLHAILDQAPNRKIGTINLKEEAKKNALDYHMALAKKYRFDPTKIGVNRHTGDLQLLPLIIQDPKRAKIKARQDAQYDPTNSRGIGYRSCRDN